MSIINQNSLSCAINVNVNIDIDIENHMQIEGENACESKKPCLEEKKNYFEKLNGDVLTKILKLLPFEDILCFEAVALNCQYLTGKNWEQLKLTKFFDFDWSECKNEFFVAKHSFILCKAIHAYIYYRTKLFDSIKLHDNVSQIYKSFEGLMIRFPSFGAYLWFDLSFLAPNLQSAYKIKFEGDLALLRNPKKDIICEGGDFLLQGLYKITCCSKDFKERVREVTTEKLGEISICFSKAIELKATCASYFAVKMITTKTNLIWHYTLGTLSSSQRDCRALDYLTRINIKYILGLYKTGIYQSSILAGMANFPIFKFGNYDEGKRIIEKSLEQAIEAYGEENVPLSLWTRWEVLFKRSRNYSSDELSKAWGIYHSYYIKFLEHSKNKIKNCYDGYIDIDFRINYEQFRLGKWEEAEKWYDKLRLVADNTNNIPIISWIRKAYIKFKLEKWSEAEELYASIHQLAELEEINDRFIELLTALVISGDPELDKNNKKLCESDKELYKSDKKFLYGDYKCLCFLYNYAFIKLKLKKYDEAEYFYKGMMDKAFDETYGFDYSDEAFMACATLYYDIQDKYQENESDQSKQILPAYEARLKSYFRQWNDVITLLQPLESIEVADHIRLAFAHLILGNWKLAEEHYDILHKFENIDSAYSYRDNYTISILNGSPNHVPDDDEALLNIWKDDISFDKKFMAQFDFFFHLAYIKIKLEKHDDASKICFDLLKRTIISINESWVSELCRVFLHTVLKVYDNENIPPQLTAWLVELEEEKFDSFID